MKHAGNIILMGFGLMLIFVSFLVYKAMSQDYDMVTQDYYEQELKINDRHLAEKNGQPFADKCTAQYRHDVDSFQLCLPAELSAKLEKGKIMFYNVQSKNADRTIALEKGMKPCIGFSGKGWQKTTYKVTFELTAGGVDYLFHDMLTF